MESRINGGIKFIVRIIAEPLYPEFAPDQVSLTLARDQVPVMVAKGAAPLPRLPHGLEIRYGATPLNGVDCEFGIFDRHCGR